MKESALIKDVKWFEGALYVYFKTGKIYEYSEVPESVYLNFIVTESPGSFFGLNIKNKYETLDVTEEFNLSEESKKIPRIQPDPDASINDSFDEYLEWTSEEEEEFLRIINDSENNGMNGATT